MGIISACLPTLRPLLSFVLRRVGLTVGGSDGANTPGRPSLITFGRGNVRQKRSGYTTTRSADRGEESLEHLSGWPESQHGKATASVGVGHTDVEMNQFHQPQSIAVRTEMAWHESHTYQQEPPVPAHRRH